MYHGVEVGMYTRGSALIPGYLPPGTRVGNYAGVSYFVRVYRRNHPFDRLSQHPFFFNACTGLLDSDSIDSVESNPLTIGHDAYVGEYAFILPRCTRIGDGAVVGAGAVVTKDVEPFTIVAGNPAQPIRRRFSPDVEEAVRESQWWLRPLHDLVDHLDVFLNPPVAALVRQISRSVGHTGLSETCEATK
jgi:acetyltransferase-like isoleucine patch superfamily enzyme